MERAARMRAAVLEMVPESRPLIAGLVKAGLITGWRNINAVYAGPPREVQGINAAEYLENSKGQYHGTAAETV